MKPAPDPACDPATMLIAVVIAFVIALVGIFSAMIFVPHEEPRCPAGTSLIHTQSGAKCIEGRVLEPVRP